VQKLVRPYYYEVFFDGPVQMANTTSQLPALKGLVLPEDTVKCLEGVTNIVEQNSSEADRIYVYPQMEIFYLLTHRRACTDAFGVNNSDVMTDQKAQEQAQLILTRRPKVLIFAREPEQFLLVLEKFWKLGKRAGNRDIIAACNTLAKEYRLAGSFTIGNFPGLVANDWRTSPAINVYVRDDDASSTTNLTPKRSQGI
jgi:hypothetical protein